MSTETTNPLAELLGRCGRDELLTLAAFIEDLKEPRPEWDAKSDADLRVFIERNVRYRGSSDVAYVYRRWTQGAERAGVAYEEILDDLMEHLAIHPTIVERMGTELRDPIYARELLVTLACARIAEKEPARGDAADLYTTALRSIKSNPYRILVEAARAAGVAVGGRGLASALAGAMTKSVGFLGPLGMAFSAYAVGRTLYSLQAPNRETCLSTVALLGSLRLKYFPLPEEKLERLQLFFASLGKDCVVCGKGLPSKATSCMFCWLALHAGCGLEVKRLDTGEDGTVCPECHARDLRGEGLLMPSGGSLVHPSKLIFAGGYRLHVLAGHVQRACETVEGAVVHGADELQKLRKDLKSDLEDILRKAFGYLWAMLFTTAFFTLLGIGYFQKAQTGPSPGFNPAMFFRLSLLIMLIIPSGIWLVGALWRATRNRKREDFDRRPDGRRLGLRDYLLGFLYYDDPIQNVWGPITLVGILTASILWAILSL